MRRRAPRPSAPSPAAPSRSKQASCGFTATQAGPAASISRGSGGRPRPRPARAGRRPPASGAAGQSCGGRGRGRGRSGCGAPRRAPPAGRRREPAPSASAALDLGLQRRPGREARHLAAGDRDPLAGARVDALPRAALGDVELAEAGEVDVAAVLEDVVIASSTASTASARGLLAADPARRRPADPGTQPSSRLGVLLRRASRRRAPNKGRGEPAASLQVPPIAISPISSGGALTEPPNGTQRGLRSGGARRREHRDQVARDRELPDRRGQLAAARSRARWRRPRTCPETGLTPECSPATSVT